MLTLRWYGGSHVTSWPWSSIRPGGRLLEAADHPQGRRLAAAGRAEQAEELAVADLEVDVVDGAMKPTSAPAPVEALGELDQPDCDVSHPDGDLLLRVVLRSRVPRSRPVAGG